MAVELDWLKDFLALAEQRNFSRAAALRHVTQPAFSRRIRALEDWIGTTLFHRLSQGAEVTPAGRHLRPVAEQMVRLLEEARRETRAVGEQETATLSIAATHALSFGFFPVWIRQLPCFESLGTINLVSDSLAGCEALMLAGEVQFLLCHAHAEAEPRLDAARFESLCVGTDRLVAVSAPDAAGSPAHRLAARGGPPPRLLAYSEDSGLGRIVAALRATEIGAAEPVMTSHHAATLASLARGGQGLAWLPLSLAEADLASFRLVRAAPAESEIPIDIRLYRAPDLRNRAARALWAGLVAA